MRTLITMLAFSLLLPAQAQPDRPRLGVRIGTDGDGRVSVTEVMAKTPAQAAGLQAGDRILKLGDQAVTGVDGLIELVRSQKWDGATTVTVLRDGQELKLPVRFARTGDTPRVRVVPVDPARPLAPTRPVPPGVPPVIVRPVLPPQPARVHEEPPTGNMEAIRRSFDTHISQGAIRDALDRAAKSLHALRSIPAVKEALKEIDRAQALLEQQPLIGVDLRGALGEDLPPGLRELVIEDHVETELPDVELIEEELIEVEPPEEELIETEIELEDVPMLDTEKLMARLQELMSSGATQEEMQQAISEEFPGVAIQIQITNEPPAEDPLPGRPGHDHPVTPAPAPGPAPAIKPLPPAPAPPSGGRATTGGDAGPQASRRLADDLRKRIADLEALIERLSQRIKNGG